MEAIKENYATILIGGQEGWADADRAIISILRDGDKFRIEGSLPNGDQIIEAPIFDSLAAAEQGVRDIWSGSFWDLTLNDE